MKKSLMLLALVAVSACSSGGGGAETTSTSTTTGVTIPQDTSPEKVGVELLLKDGKICQICVKLANTPEKQRLGVGAEGGLDGVDGMLFYSGGEMTDDFWMRNVKEPLDIHFFTTKGEPLNSVSATPCSDDTPDEKCERYKAVAAYGYALEVRPSATKKWKLAGSTFRSLMEHCPEKSGIRADYAADTMESGSTSPSTTDKAG